MRKILVCILVSTAFTSGAVLTPATAETPVARKRPVDSFPAIRVELPPGEHTLTFNCYTESEDKEGLAVAGGTFEPTQREAPMRWVDEFAWGSRHAIGVRLPGASSPVEVKYGFADHRLILSRSGEVSIGTEGGGVLRWFCAQSGSAIWRGESFAVNGASLEPDYQPDESFNALRVTDFRGSSAEASTALGVWGRKSQEVWGFMIGRLGGGRGNWIIETPSGRTDSRSQSIQFADHDSGRWAFSYRGVAGDPSYVLWWAELRFIVCESTESDQDSSDRDIRPILCTYVA